MKRIYPDFEFFLSLFWICMMTVAVVTAIAATVFYPNWISAAFGLGGAWLLFSSVRSTYRWSSIPQIGLLKVQRDCLQFSSCSRPFTDVCSIRFAIGYTKKRLNFSHVGTDATGLVSFGWQDGTHWIFRAGPGVLSIFAGSQGSDQVKDMIRKMSAVGQASKIDARRVGLFDLVF